MNTLSTPSVVRPMRRDGCDLAGSKSLPVAKPENRAISLLVFPRRNLSQNLVDLLQLNPLARRLKADR